MLDLKLLLLSSWAMERARKGPHVTLFTLRTHDTKDSALTLPHKPKNKRRRLTRTSSDESRALYLVLPLLHCLPLVLSLSRSHTQQHPQRPGSAASSTAVLAPSTLARLLRDHRLSVVCRHTAALAHTRTRTHPSRCAARASESTNLGEIHPSARRPGAHQLQKTSSLRGACRARLAYPRSPPHRAVSGRPPAVRGDESQGVPLLASCNKRMQLDIRPWPYRPRLYTSQSKVQACQRYGWGGDQFGTTSRSPPRRTGARQDPRQTLESLVSGARARAHTAGPSLNPIPPGCVSDGGAPQSPVTRRYHAPSPTIGAVSRGPPAAPHAPCPSAVITWGSSSGEGTGGCTRTCRPVHLALFGGSECARGR